MAGKDHPLCHIRVVKARKLLEEVASLLSEAAVFAQAKAKGDLDKATTVAIAQWETLGEILHK